MGVDQEPNLIIRADLRAQEWDRPSISERLRHMTHSVGSIATEAMNLRPINRLGELAKITFRH
jgi:hypothetical protein